MVYNLHCKNIHRKNFIRPTEDEDDLQSDEVSPQRSVAFRQDHLCRQLSKNAESLLQEEN